MSDQRLDESFEEELRTLVTSGQRDVAVKRYRERTGIGLMDAERAIETLARQEGITQRQTDSVEWDIISLLERGQKAQAVKFYRERRGSSLKEAKEAIDRISSEHNIGAQGGMGCLGVLALGAVFLLEKLMTPC